MLSVAGAWHTSVVMQELRVKIMREEERREREEELAQLEETVTKLKLENEKERLKAVELESLLKKHKHQVEKQQKWVES
jgi:predicted nucleic acid-binding protein